MTLEESMRETIRAICHAGSPHPHDAIERGPWGVLCSSCWSSLLKLSSAVGEAARGWEARQ